MITLFNCAILLHLVRLCWTCAVDDPLIYEAAHKSLAKRADRGPPKKTTINNVRFFDGYGFTSPQTVVLDQGIITYVGPPKTDSSDVKVDGTGKFLIPGLIDSHCHISSPANLDAMASYGVTTAVNMACYNATFCGLLRDLPGTTSMISGTLPAVGSPSIIGNLAGADPSGLLSPGDNTTAWVEAHASFPESPIKFVKVVAAPGGLTQELLSGLVASALDEGFYTAMHATYLATYEQAIIARAKILQHMPGDQVIPAEMTQKIFNQGQTVTPTMAIFRVANNSPVVRQVTGQQGTWNTTVANAAALYKAGVPLLAGSDTATVGNITMTYGLNLHCELEFLTEAGVPAVEALRAATSRPAEVQGFRDRGVIAVGKRADLLLLNANPLLNISNSRDVARVWTRGIEVANVTRNMKSQCSKLNTTLVA